MFDIKNAEGGEKGKGFACGVTCKLFSRKKDRCVNVKENMQEGYLWGEKA